MIGIGIDAVEVERFGAAILRRPRIVRRFFAENEQRVIDSPNGIQRLAARFAAKEAAWKSLGVGLWQTDYLDFEIHTLPSGQPQLKVKGRASELAERLGVSGWHISMTHTDHIAQAIVVAL